MWVDVDVIGEREAAADVKNIAERAGDPRRALRKVRDLLTRGHAKQFLSHGAYFGSSWPALAPTTVARKKTDALLVRTGALRASLIGGRGRKTSVTKKSVLVGTRVWYAHFLHGGTKRGVPARPLTGSTDGQVRTAIWILERYIVHGI